MHLLTVFVQNEEIRAEVREDFAEKAVLVSVDEGNVVLSAHFVDFVELLSRVLEEVGQHNYLEIFLFLYIVFDAWCLINNSDLNIEVKLLKLIFGVVSSRLYVVLRLYIVLSYKELPAQLILNRLNVIVEDQFFAASEDYVLGDFHTEWSQAADQDPALGLLGNCLDAHRSDVATPSVFDLVIVDIDLILNL